LAELDRIWRKHRLRIYLGGAMSWIIPLAVVIISIILHLWISLAMCAPAVVLFFVLSTRNSWRAHREHLAARKTVIDMWAGSIARGQLLDGMRRQLEAVQAMFPDET